MPFDRLPPIGAYFQFQRQRIGVNDGNFKGKRTLLASRHAAKQDFWPGKLPGDEKPAIRSPAQIVRKEADAGSTGEFRLVWPGDRRTSPRLRAFIDFAAENLLAPC